MGGNNFAVTATIVGVVAGLLVVISVACWLFWPSTNIEETGTEAKIDGNDNNVITDSHHEWTLFKIGHLEAGAVRRTWVGALLFCLLFGGLLTYACHYRLIKRPRNAIRDAEHEVRGNELDDMKFDLTEAGYLNRKRPKKKTLEKSKKKEVTIKKSKINRKREKGNEEEDEEEEI
jgi:hypothetical protein